MTAPSSYRQEVGVYRVEVTAGGVNVTLFSYPSEQNAITRVEVTLLILKISLFSVENYEKSSEFNGVENCHNSSCHRYIPTSWTDVSPN